MPILPRQLKPYLSKALALGDTYVQDVAFSGPTYQIKIHDPEVKQDVWTFIQLNPNHQLREAFCSCESQDMGGCWHLVLAYQFIFKNELSLHERFANSIWHQLARIWFYRYKAKNIKLSELKTLSIRYHSEKIESQITEIFSKNIEETEENSIKFSNLSEEELEAWNSGNPTEQLLLELSPWCDFAKFLMIYSLRNTVHLAFDANQSSLPKQFEIQTKDFTIVGEIFNEDWLEIIPFLNSTESNLKTYNRLQDQIDSISYNADEKSLHLAIKTVKKEMNPIVEIGKWEFIPKKGFYLKSIELPEIIPYPNVDLFLKSHEKEMGALLTNAHWDSTVHVIKFKLYFDRSWNLNIEPFLFTEGDLIDPKAALWDHFCYLPRDGFFKISESTHNFPVKILEKNLVGFVKENTSFFNAIEEFKIHLGTLDTQILYSVDEKGNLKFDRKVTFKNKKTHEFGPWIYLEGEGFFNKFQSSLDFPIDFGQPIRSELVAPFIRHHQLELEQISNFFLKESPFLEIGLEIIEEAKNRIRISPYYVLKPRYEKNFWIQFDNWVYVQGYGFTEIPYEDRLPEKYRDSVWIQSKDFVQFFDNEFSHIEHLIKVIDQDLAEPKTIHLILDRLEEAPLHSWYLEIHYETENGKILLKDLLKAFEKKKPFYMSPAGRVDLRADRWRWLKRLKPESIQNNERLHLSTIDLLRLHAYEEIIAFGSLKQQLEEILNLKKIPPFDCGELKSHLRSYQEKGAEWLFSLSVYALGGLLCDEMGLGKTHQAMGLMAGLRKINPEASFLIICPTSVLYHWEDKLREYFPTLHLKCFHGTFRNKDYRGKGAILTTYGVYRSDREWFKSQRFTCAIFDEIQVAKNHRSKLHVSLLDIKAETKIGLTGTPLENNLRELKSLFDIVLPNYMPNESDYMRSIVKPIEKSRNTHQKTLLQRLTYPFILRRQKKDVLKELPDKTEEIAFCDMHPAQEKLYRETLLFQREELMKALVDTATPIPYLHIFSLLTRLKQICNHPALYYKQTSDFRKYHSGKWDLFIELLSEARDSQQKVVVYSQYLGMLDIIESYLKESGIGFAALRGSTRDRKEQMQRFASDPTCEVFVASLKAAGLGIDLTSASVVIHFDRWWNAAREDQATDRVHRFGQNKGVQVFKLVTKDSFEERIHQIIERKKQLFANTISIDEHDILKSFTRDELFQLLMMNESL